MPAILATYALEGDALPEGAAAARFEAFEGISEPFTVEVEFTTKDAGFVVESCLRTHLCLVVTPAIGEPRLFDGIVDRARFIRAVGEERHFAVRLRPALAALEHREGSRIFQDKTIVQVAQTIFQEAGFGDKVEWRLTKEYEPREFIVQYRETHLNFISRLLEDDGLFYFFRHDASGHTLVIADDSAAFVPDESATPVVFMMSQGGSAASGGAGTGSAEGGSGTMEPLARFSRTRALRTTSVRLVDYDFERPSPKPVASLPSQEGWPMPYAEYPGGFTQGAVGARRANARMRALRADADLCRGESYAAGLRVGAPFTVAGVKEGCLSGTFVVTRLVSRGTQTLTGGAGNTAIENRFTAIPEGAPFAAPRRAHKPRIRGVQTAIVTGSSKQEQALHVDKYGRIKVRFYWDREGQQDHTSSCWIRVSQPMLGGSMILPRVGWEVTVMFLEGDPDRPVVTGRVYNAEKPPPYPLPASKTSGALKSMSSPGAGGHNEFNFGDSGGGQGFGVHAQKDLNVTIGHDRDEQIAGNEESLTKVNGSSSVKSNETWQVGGNQSLEVGSVLSHKVSGAQSIHVGGNDTSNAISNYVEKVDGARSYKVSGNQITICNGIEQSVTGDFKRSVGALQLTGSVGSINDNVLGSLTETAGAVKVQIAIASAAEQITTSKSQTYAAAELHLTKGGISQQAGASVTNLVGGLHYQKLAGDFVVQAPLITLVGAVGVFKGGSSELKLGGGPVVIKGDTIAVKSPLIVKMGASMKLGA